MFFSLCTKRSGEEFPSAFAKKPEIHVKDFTKSKKLGQWELAAPAVGEGQWGHKTGHLLCAFVILTPRSCLLAAAKQSPLRREEAFLAAASRQLRGVRNIASSTPKYLKIITCWCTGCCKLRHGWRICSQSPCCSQGGCSQRGLPWFIVYKT